MLKKTFPHQFIAVEGNIGAGKTTFCRKVAEHFNCRLILEQFTDNPFLPSFYENPERHAFPVELFFMAERHKQLQEQLAQSDLFRKTTIADYYFVKTLLFARNNLNQQEFQLFQRLFNILNATFPKPDLLVYFHRPIHQLLTHIEKRGRSFERNIGEEYLLKIQKAYFDYFNTRPNVPVLFVHLGEKDFGEDDNNFSSLVKMLQKKYDNGFHEIHL